MTTPTTSPPDAPLLGAVLIGGDSRRMGQPKQLLRRGGLTFAELAARALRPHVGEVVVSGAGELACALTVLHRVRDVPGIRGPLAGLIALSRHRPDAAWVVAACDLPLVTPDAIAWLLGQRAPGRLAVLPRTTDGRVHPLLALYEPAAGPELEALLSSGRLAPRQLQDLEAVATPTPPPPLAACWTNVNAPADLAELPWP